MGRYRTLVLSEPEAEDAYALLTWALQGRPGVPQTAVLRRLWSRLREFDEQKGKPQLAY